MDCVNHPGTAAQFFCQNCGKPLCPACTRQGAPGLGVSGPGVPAEILCEPCFAARQSAQWAASANPGPIPGNYPQNPASAFFNYGASFPASTGPNPRLAAAIGLIPGVGAMYNGQFLKGLIHVGIFAVLCMLSENFPYVGLLIAGWVFYQSFEAFHTACALRDGLPVPDPLGLNDVARWINPNLGRTQNPTAAPPPPGASTAGFSAAPPSEQAQQQPAPPYTEAWQGSYPPPPGPVAYDPVTGAPIPQRYCGGPRFNTGAIVLIALGCIFLIDNVGWFAHRVFSFSWPLLLIGLGVWRILRQRNSGGF